MDDPDRNNQNPNGRRDGPKDAAWRLREQIEKQLDTIRKLCRKSARQVEESRAILARIIRLRRVSQ